MTTTKVKTPVLLLKTQSLPKDPYEALISASEEYLPTFLPVLTHTFSEESLAQLRAILSHPEQCLKTYPQGVVLTSQRAVEGLDLALSQKDDLSLSAIRSIWFTAAANNDNKLSFYVVGPATHLSVSALVAKHFPPNSITIEGRETGTGEALVEFILNHSQSAPTANKRRLLFPTGEKRKDTVPRLLGENGWIVDEIPCYQTVTRAEFAGELQQTVDSLNKLKINQIWVVVFSPQGCKEMLQNWAWLDTADKCIQPYGTSQGRSDAAAFHQEPWIRVMSIGPTTERYLLDEFNFKVDIVAGKPSAEGVLQALKEG